MYHFEFDEKKSASNIDKHEIDFVTAQESWNDPDLVEVQAASDGESRFLIIVCIEGRHWPAVITYRENNIRIISVRRSQKSEIELYEI